MWTSWHCKRRMWLSWQLMGSGMSCPTNRWHSLCGASSLGTERIHIGTVAEGDLTGPGLVQVATAAKTVLTQGRWPDKGLRCPKGEGI